MNGAELLVKALENERVEYVFGIPGEENLDVLDALSRSSIKLILTRHEQAAGFMAATYGRLTGKAGVCLSTLGPGATNLVTAAAHAQLGGMPMLMITGQKPITMGRQGQFQIIDVVDMMHPLTKKTCQIQSANNIPSRIREAIRLAEEERPGATHLELPEDIARDDADAPLVSASFVRRPIAEQKSILTAVERIERAKSPLLLVGAAANRTTTCHMLRRFIDQTEIPFVTTQMGKGVVDETHPLNMGNAALSEGDFVHRAIDAADLIINVGHDITEKPPFLMQSLGVEVIHVNFFSASVDPVYFPQIEVVGDIAKSIEQICEGISKQSHWDFARFQKIREASEKYLAERIDDNRFPISPQRLVADVRCVMSDKGIIALDNGMFKIWFARNYKARYSNTVLLDNALATMGAGLPSAMAARLVYPGRQVIAICGDGGFMMNSQELETAVRLQLNLVVLILRDDSFGMIKWKQEQMGMADFGLRFHNPDFIKYAESYGAHGHRTENTSQFVPLMKECLTSQGVHVIDIPIDYSANNRALNQEIPALSAQA